MFGLWNPVSAPGQGKDLQDLFHNSVRTGVSSASKTKNRGLRQHQHGDRPFTILRSDEPETTVNLFLSREGRSQSRDRTRETSEPSRTTGPRPAVFLRRKFRPPSSTPGSPSLLKPDGIVTMRKAREAPAPRTRRPIGLEPMGGGSRKGQAADRTRSMTRSMSQRSSFLIR